MRGLKSLLFPLFCFISFSAWAQITIEGTYLPVRGTAIRQVYDTVGSQLFVPSEGENQFWDYSDKFVDVTDTFALQTFHPDSAGAGAYRHLFPNATHASYLTMPFVNSIGHQLYSYFTIDSVGVTNIGAYSVRPDLDTAVYYEDPELFMPFEVNYGDTMRDTVTAVIYQLITDTAIVMPPFPTPIQIDSLFLRIVESRTKVVTASAYGTLKTPIGRFENVVLGKEEMVSTTKAFYKFSTAAEYINDGIAEALFPTVVDIQNRYNFVANNTFGSTHLLLLVGDTAESYIRMGWYTLPADIGYIAGLALDTNDQPVTSGKALLYREHSNFAKDDVLDTAQIKADGSFRFDSIPLGQYRIAVRANKSDYPRSLSTYTGDVTLWEDAEVIHTQSDVDDVTIHIQYAAPPPGQSFVSGALQFNSIAVSSVNKTTGDPIPGIDVSLEQIPGGEISYQTTTEDQQGGDFYFDNVAPGTYAVWVEVPGMPMCQSATLTLGENQNAEELNFVAQEDQICASGEPSIVTGIGNTSAQNNLLLSAHPNPFTSHLRLTYDSKNVDQIKIFGPLGHLIRSIERNGERQNALTVDLSTQPSGIYLIQFTNTINGQLQYQKAIKLDQ